MCPKAGSNRAVSWDGDDDERHDRAHSTSEINSMIVSKRPCEPEKRNRGGGETVPSPASLVGATRVVV